MSQFLPPLLLLVLIVGLIAVVKALLEKGGGSRDFPYQKEPTLFTPAERSFLGVLDQAVGDEFRIMGKVRLADVIRVRPGLSASERQTALNKIQSKHLDFVAYDPGDLSVQCAIELDDKSHSKAKRQQRDAFLDAAMAAAGVPLIRFPAQKAYSIPDVRQALSDALNDENVEEAALEVNMPVEEAAQADGAPLCADCGGDMVLRTAKRGANAGQQFWGCSNYPRCRKMLPV